MSEESHDLDDAPRPVKAVAVAWDLDAKLARDLGLVLTARGVPHSIRDGGASFAILVAPRFAARAQRELRNYVAENRGWPPRDLPEAILTPGIGAALAGAAFLGAAYLAQSRSAFGLNWETIGRLDGAAVRSGAIERCATSLLLHADVVHVMSNVVFGLPLLAALCQPFGAGIGLLLALLSGILGNAASVGLHDPGYLAIGASTAIFGALGALLAQRFFGERGRARSRVARFLPVALGLGYLGLVGVGGERTDVVAHLTGFVCGAVLGAFAARLPAASYSSQRLQMLAAITCGALLSGAWVAALLRASP